MANPQPDEFLKISRELAEAFARFRLPGQEWQVLWVILRKTYGFSKKSDWISLGQFSKLTGIDRSKCCRLLGSLVNKRVITKGVARKGSTTHIIYGLQKDYERWRVLSKRSPGDQKGNEMLSKRSPTIESITIEKKRPKSKLTDFDDRVLSLSLLLKDKILENKPDRMNPNVQGTPWLVRTASAIEKLIRLNKRTPEKIRAVIKFCQADNQPHSGNGFYWSKNILSGVKLREKFDDLEVALKDSQQKAAPRGRFGV